jgi:4-alpha-glucanotransferase
MTIKAQQNYLAFTEWEDEYKNYSDELFQKVQIENCEEVEFWQFTQYIFLKQWKAVKKYANDNGITIMGDMPIYVATDSVEMWKYKKELFLLDSDGNPALVAGVPPDAFSDDGQLWGNPVYNWDYMKSNGYKWWKERIKYAFELFDSVRIDHFRGFDRFFTIEVGEETAKNGTWMKGPSAELFKGFENYDIIAEDLGVIDEGVIEMMEKVGYPGMKVVEFAFDGNPENEHKPTNFTENCVAYTGTHDNQPLTGYIKGLSDKDRAIFDKDLKTQCNALGLRCQLVSAEARCKTTMRLIMASKANTCIFPMQDILRLGDYSRMNFPSTVSLDNWSYRFLERDFSTESARWLKDLIKRYGR